MKGVGRKRGRGLSHFGHSLEIWVKKKMENLWKGSGYLIFIVFLASHPLQPVCASHCSHLLCQQSSRAWCITAGCSVGEGLGGAHWEAGAHCNAKGTSIAKTQPGRRTGLCPCCSLWSAVCRPGCAPPLPDTSWDLQSICQRSLENIPINILGCPLAVTCEGSMGCSSCTVVFLLAELVCSPEVNVASECIPRNVLGSSFLLSEWIQSPVHHETLGYSTTSRSCIYNWSILSTFLSPWCACLPAPEACAPMVCKPQHPRSRVKRLKVSLSALHRRGWFWSVGTWLPCQDLSWLSQGMSEVLWSLMLSTRKKGIELMCITTEHAIHYQVGKIISRTGQLWLSGLNPISCSQGTWMKGQERWNFGLRGMMLSQLSWRGVSSGGSHLQPVHVGNLGLLKKHWRFGLCFSYRSEDESENYNRAAEATAAGDEESQVCPGACPSLHSALWRCPPGMDGCIMGMVTLTFPAENKSQV